MIIRKYGAVCAAAACVLSATNAPASEQPSLEDFKALVEPAVRERLMDPESARFDWPYLFHTASNGLVTCGYVNSKNRMGGYAGKSFVIVVYNKGSPPYFNIAEDDSKWDGVTGMCLEYIRKGDLLPR